MTEVSRVVYRARNSATPKAEIAALSAVYKFVLAKREATRPGSPDDAMKGSSDDRARTIIPNK
jgi:hypothetical protein